MQTAKKMIKLTNNMMRVISHSYATNHPVLFLHSVGLLNKIEDKEVMQKAYKIAGLINSLTEQHTTKSEEEFYSFEINAENFEKELAKERQGMNIVTAREKVLACGVVYSECITYMYNSLTKYDPVPIDLADFTKSVEDTYTRLLTIDDSKDTNITSQELTQAISDIATEVQSYKAAEGTIQSASNKCTDELISTIKTIQAELKEIKTARDTIQDKQIESTSTITNAVKDLQEQLQELKVGKETVQDIENNSTQDITNELNAIKEQLQALKTNKNAVESTQNLLVEELKGAGLEIEQINTSILAAKSNLEDTLLMDFESKDKSTDLLDNFYKTIFATVEGVVESEMKDLSASMLNNLDNIITNRVKQTLNKTIEHESIESLNNMVYKLTSKLDKSQEAKDYSNLIDNINKLQDSVEKIILNHKEQLDMLGITVEQANYSINRAKR